MVDPEAQQNQRSLRRLVVSVQASYGRLNLLIALCDNWKYRDELIRTYEAELQAKGAKCYSLRIDNRQPSLKQSLSDLLVQEPALQDATTPALVTVLGADELLGLRLSDPKSAQERFFFSLQWTREALREFRFPILLWLTPDIASALAQQAPDFWSWRGGVFEFSQPIAQNFPLNPASFNLPEQPVPPAPTKALADPAELQQQIDALQAQDPDSPLLASLYDSLGEAYEGVIRYAEAEAPYLKALELRERQLGVDHPDVATSLNNLALLYKTQGRYSEAEPLYERSLSIWERQLGADHPDVATSLNNLALLYESQGRYSEAEPLYTRSLYIWEQQLGSDHPNVATSLNNLALLYESQGRYSEAEPLLVRSFSIWEQQLGADHPNISSSLNNLAGLYESQGRYSEAEPLYTRSLEIDRKVYGEDHPDIATDLNNLAYLYESQGRYSEAEPLYARSLSILEKVLPANHPTLAIGRENLERLRSQLE
jgi:tetratricopeptide (TPR) repeat protein